MTVSVITLRLLLSGLILHAFAYYGVDSEDGAMRILHRLADNLTATMLKRWMIIWLTMVIIGVVSIFP
jgi:ABC-type transport system involved in cytochrome c biogenesis permease component